MSLAFTAGSLGDIIAVTTIINNLIEVLDDSRGSVKEYHGVVTRLHSQLTVVNRVKEIFGGQAQTPKEAEIQAEVRQVLAQIRTYADDLLAKIAKFAPSLTNGGSGNMLKDALKKVKWRLKREEIEAFERNVDFHTGLLKIHLGVTNWDTAEANRDQLSRQITQSSNESRTALNAQSRTLRGLGTFLMALGHALFFQLHQVAQVCKDMKMNMAQMFQLLAAILPLLQKILSNLEQLTTPLEGLYFVLVDHLGARRKMFLDNIMSWDMFHRFVAIAYESEMGDRRTAYKFHVPTAEENISHDIRRIYEVTPWKSAFEPSQVIHLKFPQQRISNPKEIPSACPRCDFLQPETTRQARQTCSNCGLHFVLVFDSFELEQPTDDDDCQPQTLEHPERDSNENTDSSYDSGTELPQSRYQTMPQQNMTWNYDACFVANWIAEDDDVSLRLMEAEDLRMGKKSHAWERRAN